MASMIPYGNYERALRRQFPFDMFDDFFASPLTAVNANDAFKMDVEDVGTAYVITAQLAGVKRDEIDVELNEGRLSISVNKVESEEEQNKNYLHKETHAW
ncbi:MAG: Hsp20 family protein, partial [Atopobiaceae bacterium]|nr:Hsp20 family protein [Atopobiaceae bacterium]